MEHTTFEAEAIRITLGMHMLRYEKDIKTTTIGLDNQAVVTSMDIQKPKSGQHIDEFLWQTEHKWR